MALISLGVSTLNSNHITCCTLYEKNLHTFAHENMHSQNSFGGRITL
jgi:hypothetical protein